MLKFATDIENDNFALPAWETLMRYRVVICSCLDASILVTAQCTNSSLARLESDIVSTLHPRRKHPIAPHWTHLLIDEVSRDRYAEAISGLLLSSRSVILYFS